MGSDELAKINNVSTSDKDRWDILARVLQSYMNKDYNGLASSQRDTNMGTRSTPGEDSVTEGYNIWTSKVWKPKQLNDVLSWYGYTLYPGIIAANWQVMSGTNVYQAVISNLVLSNGDRKVATYNSTVSVTASRDAGGVSFNVSNQQALLGQEAETTPVVQQTAVESDVTTNDQQHVTTTTNPQTGEVVNQTSESQDLADITYEGMLKKSTGIYSDWGTAQSIGSVIAGNKAVSGLATATDNILIGPIKSFIIWLGEQFEGLCVVLWQGATGEATLPTIDEIIFNQTSILNANVLSPIGDGTGINPTMVQLNKTVKRLYGMFLTMGIGVMFILLVVTIIKISTTTIAQEKADYKTGLTAWVTGIIMIFGIPIMISLMFGINETIVSGLYNSYKATVRTQVEEANKRILGQNYELLDTIGTASQVSGKIDNSVLGPDGSVMDLAAQKAALKKMLRDNPDTFVMSVTKDKMERITEEYNKAKQMKAVVTGVIIGLAVIALTVATAGAGALLSVGALGAAGAAGIGAGFATAAVVDLINYLANSGQYVIVAVSGLTNGMQTYFYLMGKMNDSLPMIIIWLLFLGQSLTLIWIYLKRMFYIVILLLMSPFISVYYVLNKGGIMANKVFNTWSKEIGINIFLQTIHAAVYSFVLIAIVGVIKDSISWYHGTGAMLVLALVFMIPKLEELIRKILGLESSFAGSMRGGMKDLAVTAMAAKAGVKAVSNTVSKGKQSWELGRKAKTMQKELDADMYGTKGSLASADDGQLSGGGNSQIGGNATETSDGRRPANYNQRVTEINQDKLRAKALRDQMGKAGTDVKKSKLLGEAENIEAMANAKQMDLDADKKSVSTVRQGTQGQLLQDDNKRDNFNARKREIASLRAQSRKLAFQTATEAFMEPAAMITAGAIAGGIGGDGGDIIKGMGIGAVGADFVGSKVGGATGQAYSATREMGNIRRQVRAEKAKIEEKLGRAITSEDKDINIELKALGKTMISASYTGNIEMAKQTYSISRMPTNTGDAIHRKYEHENNKAIKAVADTLEKGARKVDHRTSRSDVSYKSVVEKKKDS